MMYGYIDIAGRSSARICRALTFALIRLSCLNNSNKYMVAQQKLLLYADMSVKTER